jgi:hypothetical protein
MYEFVKNAQIVAQTPFLPKLIHNFFSEKNSIILTKFKKIAHGKQSPNLRKFGQSGTDVMILKIFSAKKLAFMTESKANF